MPERQNDESIGNSERLWRRVHPYQIKWTLNPPVVSTGAFNTADGVSVSIASETTLELLTQNYSEQSVVEFQAGYARSLGCILQRDPTPEDPAHVLVWGPKARGRLNSKQLDGLSCNAVIILSKPPPSDPNKD